MGPKRADGTAKNWAGVLCARTSLVASDGCGLVSTLRGRKETPVGGTDCQDRARTERNFSIINARPVDAGLLGLMLGIDPILCARIQHGSGQNLGDLILMRPLWVQKSIYGNAQN